MKSPLRKRLFRLLKQEFGKYLAIFLFMIIMVGFVSGEFVAGRSMFQTYNSSFSTYNIEDGKLELTEKADKELIKTMEKHGIQLYANFYKDETMDSDTIRIYANRKEIDKVCLMEGSMPKTKKEIALDRMYADNNEIHVGDTITIDSKQLKVCGLVALSDYSTLFEKNTDIMFDALDFGTGIMTKEGFDDIRDTHIHYQYSWLYNKKPKNDTEKKKKADTLLEKITEDTFLAGNPLTDYVPQYINQAIHFTGDDIDDDSKMMVIFLYILIVILGFIFAITTKNTINQEATVIGTLRASGYSRMELLRHYIALPIIVSVAASVVGNILGYTVFKDIAVDLYYNSYSLPTYHTVWNANAFWMTTVVPLILMLLINMVIIGRLLQLSPLRFLRHDLVLHKQKKAMRLPKWSFFNRFRLRILFQNKASYLILVLGLFLVNVLMMFGFGLPDTLGSYQQTIENNMIAKYQYVLKTPLETDTKDAEKYCMRSLETVDGIHIGENVTIYGIEKNSKMVNLDVSEDKIYISKAFADKFGYKEGDRITLKEKYEDKEYRFTIDGIYDYQSNVSIFMSISTYRDLFDVDNDTFTGYFSNHKIKDIDEDLIAGIITKSEMTKISRQLDHSMGGMMDLVNGFSVLLALLMIYLLTKIIVERNANSISMVKVLGFTNREISSLYLRTSTWIVVLSALGTSYFALQALGKIWLYYLQSFSGWMPVYVSKWTMAKIIMINLAAYFLIMWIDYRKIQKIPMQEALKNVGE